MRSTDCRSRDAAPVDVHLPAHRRGRNRKRNVGHVDIDFHRDFQGILYLNKDTVPRRKEV